MTCRHPLEPRDTTSEASKPIYKTFAFDSDESIIEVKTFASADDPEIAQFVHKHFEGAHRLLIVRCVDANSECEPIVEVTDGVLTQPDYMDEEVVVQKPDELEALMMVRRMFHVRSGGHLTLNESQLQS